MPLYADAVDNLLKTKIVLAGDQYNKILFKTAGEVPTDGSIFGGYAVFTNGDVIALTSHQGAFDSEAQTFPDSSGRISTLDPGDITFGLCNETQIEEGFCGPEWHGHLVKPVDDSLCSFKAIGALTFEEPNAEVTIKAKKIIATNVKLGDWDTTNSLTGENMVFNAGLPADANPETAALDGAAFDLNPVFGTGGELLAVCIGDPATPPV